MNRPILMALAIILFCVSCGHETMNKLHHVESIIQEHPDSALVVLNEIPSEELTTTKQRAYYSLLYAKALDKNYIDTTDVSIIEPAVEYYSKHRRDDKYAEALFYKGRIYQNGGDNQSAITYFNQALDEASEDNHILLDLIHTYIAIAYTLTNDSIDALIHAEAAYEESVRTGLVDNINSNLFALAEAHHNNAHFVVADSLLVKLLTDIDRDNQMYWDATVLCACNSAEMPHPDLRKALELFDHAFNHGVTFYPEAYYEYKYCILKEDPKRDISYLEPYLCQSSSPAIFWWQSKLNVLDKDYISAYANLEAFVTASQEFVSKALTQSLIRQSQLYYQCRLDNTQYRQQKTELLLAVAVLAILLLIVLFICIYLYRQKIVKTQIDKLEDSLSATKELLYKNEIENDRLRSVRDAFVNQYRQQFSEIDMLCEHGVRTINNKWFDSMRIRLSHSLDRMVLDIIEKEGEHKYLEHQLNKDLNNLIHNLREDMNGTVSDEEILIFCYSVLGLSGKAVSFLLRIPSSTCRSKKARLKQKIEKLSSRDRDIYLSFM